MSYDAYLDSQTYLAVSLTSDPGGYWWIYTIESNTSGILYDQPFFGVDSDKVVVSWNDFSCGTCFVGQETWVVQKSDMLAGAYAGMSYFGPDICRYRVVPAQALTATTTAYLVYNNAYACSSASFLGEVAITGTPDQGNVAWTETDLSIAPTSPPPSPQEPGGSWMSPGEIDDRFLGAVWQNNVLWTDGNDGCVPPGSVEHDCVRLIELATGIGSGTILQDFDWAYLGGDVYYPAVTVDGAGNLYAVATESSASAYPFVLATGQAAGSGSLAAGWIVEYGQAYYDGARWGDYSGAAVDPSNRSVVWVAGEYAEYPHNACSSGECNWATGVGELMFQVQQPTATATATATPTPTSTPNPCPPRCPAPQVTPIPTEARTPAGQVTPSPVGTRAPG